MTREIPDDIAKAMADSMREVVASGRARRGENFDRWVELLDPTPPTLAQLRESIAAIVPTDLPGAPISPNDVRSVWGNGAAQMRAAVLALFPEATS
jgi:hypothetical protein